MHRHQISDILTDMVDVIRDSLVKPGVLLVRTKEVFQENNVITLESAAQYTREANQIESLRRRFVTGDIALYRRQLDSDALVQTHVPTGSYSPGALQVIALRPEVMRNEQVVLVKGRVPVLTIYDFPEDAQREYFRQILASTYATDEQYRQLGHGDFTVLFTENSARSVSDEEHRIARTIAEPHTQIWVANGTTNPLGDDHIIPEPLRRERKLIALLGDQVSSTLSQLQKNHSELLPDFSLRLAPPFGYVMHTNIGRNMRLDQQSMILSNLMRMHHGMYRNAALKNVEAMSTDKRHEKLFESLLPQPSYKVFGTLNQDGKLDISIAPTIIAKTGVVEVLDRRLIRDSNNEPFFNSEDEEGLYFKAIAESLENTLD